MRDLARWTAAALAAACPALMAAGDAGPDPKDPASWSLHRHALSRPANAPAPAPVQLVLDDGSREVDVGFSAVAADQFLWFNRFDPPAPGEFFDLEEIQVLFPPGPDVVPGAAVELVVFNDPDGDPSSGADLLISFDDVIQVVDGTSFSVYPIDPPLRLLPGTGDLLVGVVNRFVVSGVSPPSRPAALDTSASAGRSWVALWSGDPPDPPVLPSDDLFDRIDFLEPGNWMIRATGSVVVPPPPVTDVPALGGLGLAALAMVLALLGTALVRRDRVG